MSPIQLLRHRLSAVLLAEFVGTAMLLCAVIGSGIMAERLAGGNLALTLLANTLATVFALFVLIEILRPVSGAHFNPVITLVLAARARFGPPNTKLIVCAFIVVQLLGAIFGAWLANLMFQSELLQFSSKLRSGWGQWLGEVVATAGLLIVVLRAPADRVAALVACYIGGAYWFTSSTSFANPAAVLGRMLSDSFAGIAPSSALPFVLAQLVGGALGAGLAHFMAPSSGTPSDSTQG